MIALSTHSPSSNDPNKINNSLLGTLVLMSAMNTEILKKRVVGNSTPTNSRVLMASNGCHSGNSSYALMFDELMFWELKLSGLHVILCTGVESFEWCDFQLWFCFVGIVQ